MIKDSGDRRTFSTGAVRDMQEGKGRCDLMPLQIIARLLETKTGDYIIRAIAKFAETSDTKYLYSAVISFSPLAFNSSIETMILELAKHFEDGAKKYGENNWQRGLPVNCYLDSAIRHYLKWRRGDKDEPHDRAFVWNLVCCIWEVDIHGNKNPKN